MMKQFLCYPRPTLLVVDEMYRTLRKLQKYLSSDNTAHRIQHIDAAISRLLQLRIELSQALGDAILSEAVYMVVYRYAISPSYQAFISTLNHHLREVKESGRSRTSLS